MAIRISGLTSGLDTDSIVQELVSAYQLIGNYKVPNDLSEYEAIIQLLSLIHI